MQRDLHGYVSDVQKIPDFAQGTSREEHLAKDMLRLAVERALLNAEEPLVCASRLTDRITDHIPEVRGVTALRNIVVHNYTSITDSEIVEIVRIEVPELLRDAEDWLRTL